MICTLKRCQGKRGCLCPKGAIPIGCYAGRKIDGPTDQQVQIKSIERLPSVSPTVSPTKPTHAQQPNKTSSSLPKIQLSNKKAANHQDTTASNKSPPITTDPVVETPCYSNGMNGEVVIRYNHYKKKFSITDGSTTSAVVDAEYYLSFAFPKSKIHITLYGPSDFSFEEQGLTSRPILKENPPGTYWGLDPSKEYWVDIEEDAAEREAYELRQEALAKENAAKRAMEENMGEDANCIIKSKTESCSCIEGNPCLDRYACKDWEHRYDVAKRNGWKGFQ